MSGSESGRLTLRGIEIFVAVAETGSLAEAAERLPASPSSVSQQVTNLEAALGARLVDRAARPLVLTPAGHLFLARARRILDEATRARSELAEFGLSGLPELRIAAVEELDADVSPGLAARLGEILPSGRITVTAGPSHANIAALMDRATDIAIAGEIDPVPDWIERHAVLRDPYVLVTAKGLVGRTDAPLEKLRAAPLISYTPAQLMQKQIGAQFRRLRFDPVTRYAFDNNKAVMAMVIRTGGWTVSTPIGYMSAARFREALDLSALPFKGFARTLFLYARRGVLGSLPERAAASMRAIVETELMPAVLAEAPWLADQFRLLEGDAGPTD